MKEQIAGHGNFRMVNVGEKAASNRRALAEGSIIVGEEVCLLIREKQMPKGDVLALAEAAGIMAAKKTSDIIPLCHPLPLDQVLVRCRLNDADNSVSVSCEASALAKTGVEMEAITGVSAALLCIYDLAKAVTPVLTISNIRLRIKEGGKSGRWVHPDVEEETQSISPEPVTQAASLAEIRTAIITISDRVSMGKVVDQSGPIIEEYLRERDAILVDATSVSDDKQEIQEAINQFVFRKELQLVITTGGTGLGPRDVTPEAISELCDRPVPGLGEYLRTSGLKHTVNSVLSRTVCGLLGKTLVISLPGNPKGVSQSLESLEKLIPHALAMMAGKGH